MSVEKVKKFLLYTAFIGLVLALVYVGLKHIFGLLLPFIIALVISFVVQRPSRFIARKLKISQKIVAPIITFLIYSIFVGAVTLVCYLLVTEVVELFSTLPDLYNEYYPQVVAKLAEMAQWIMVRLPEDFAALLRNVVYSIENSISDWLVSLSKWAASFAVSLVTEIPSILLGGIVTLVASFFMCGNLDTIAEFLNRQMSERHYNLMRQLKRAFSETIGKMLIAYLLIMLITFVELSFGIWIIGFDYAVFVAAIITVVDILPVLGTGLIVIPWGLVNIIMGNVPRGIGLLALYAIVTIVRNIIEPRLVGWQIGMPPLLTLFGMYIGMKLFGLFGIFAVPLLMIFVKIVNDTGIIKIWKSASEEGKDKEIKPNGS